MTPTDLPRRAHLLILALNYHPEPVGNAPYSTGFAQHLAARGHRVSVVAGMPYYPEWRVAGRYARRLRCRERVGGVDIYRFRQYVPARQTALRRAAFEGSFFLQALAALALPRPDAVIGVLPTVSDGVLAALAARRYGVPFALLVQDLSGQAAEQTGIAGGGRVAGLVRRLEGWSARRAAAVAIVAEGFRPYLEALGVPPGRIHRVRNWVHIPPAGLSRVEARAALGLPADAPICLHAGSMGLKQGLETLVECARLARAAAPALRFVLLGDGSRRAHLEALAAGLDNVSFLPPQPDARFAAALAAADVLLLTQRPAVTDMALPSRLTSYLASGRPIVAAVAPRSEAAAELRAAGAGSLVEPGRPDALLAAIEGVLADADAARAMGERGRRYAETTFSAAAALGRLEAIVTDLLPRPAPATLAGGARRARAAT